MIDRGHDLPITKQAEVLGALFYSWRGWPRTPLATLHPSECHWRYGET